MPLFDSLFGWPAVDDVFADWTTVQRMLDFEAALARAEARTGIIPASAVEAITAQCRADLFEFQVLAEAGERAGNIAIPVIKELTAKVAATDQTASGFVHWGATSQDVIDTALVLQLRVALDFIEADLQKLIELLSDLAIRYRRTPMVARTWMRQGIPTTAGLKFATCVDALGRHFTRVAQTREQVIVLQFGGAAGTLASLKDKGLDVARALAEELDLILPAVPWHTHRDRFVAVATTLGLLTGTLGKIGRDLSLLSQTEINEILEPEGEDRGSSSTMPQKRNPVTAAVVLAAAVRVPGLVSAMLNAMLQENERGLGGWHAEWETLPQLVRTAAGALHHLTETVARLKICPDRMQHNLDATRGLIFAEAVSMALAPLIGKSQAHQIVESCAREALENTEHLREVLRRHQKVSALLSPAEMDRLFDPLSYLGVADDLIDRAISSRGPSL